MVPSSPLRNKWDLKDKIYIQKYNYIENRCLKDKANTLVELFHPKKLYPAVVLTTKITHTKILLRWKQI